MVDWRALLRGLAIDAGRFAVLLLGDSWGKSARSDCASPVGTGWRILGENCEATRIRLFDQLESGEWISAREVRDPPNYICFPWP